MKLLKLLGILILVGLILFSFAKFYLTDFLAYTKHVDSKNFLIEAWISSYEIEQAVKDYGHDNDSRFYIVGYLYPELEPKKAEAKKHDSQVEIINSNGIWLYANSSLGFTLPADMNLHLGDKIGIIVTVKGQESANYFAYFNVVVNGKSIGGAFTQTDYREYIFNWVVPVESLKTCYIKFNNDLVVNNSDRNLNIKSVKINNRLLIADTGNTIIVRDLNNLTSGFGSQAEETGNYLQQLGIDQKQISIIKFKPTQSNQTLAAAEKFNDYFSLSSLSAINVITYDIHSRRTWLTYQRILGKQTNVGVLYYPSSRKDNSNKQDDFSEFLYIIDEFLAYCVNWFLLTF